MFPASVICRYPEHGRWFGLSLLYLVILLLVFFMFSRSLPLKHFVQLHLVLVSALVLLAVSLSFPLFLYAFCLVVQSDFQYSYD